MIPYQKIVKIPFRFWSSQQQIPTPPLEYKFIKNLDSIV